MHSLLSVSYAAKWSAYAPLVLRVATGLVFFMHGYQKMTEMGVAGVTGFLGSLGFPMAGVFAAILIAAELLGGAALILGVFTRLSAKILAIVSIVAWATVHMGKGFFVNTGGFELIMMLLAANIALMIMGGGAFSVDRMWKKSESAQA